uniref:Uncharacterized protein n=1 Tax=Triticum urartu TaxID=4572 RepID=A0A8R7Q2V4_TRIUA
MRLGRPPRTILLLLRPPLLPRLQRPLLVLPPDHMKWGCYSLHCATPAGWLLKIVPLILL